jgi:hypothetical protein
MLDRGGLESTFPPVGRAEVRLKGKSLYVPSAEIDGRTVLETGKWLKIAEVRDEALLDGDTLSDPEQFVSELKRSGLRADILTFAQRLPEISPKYEYHTEWENAAAIPITGYSRWWKSLPRSTRQGVNRARKLGVTVEVAQFDDRLVETICRIYNESPVRQGKAFWHYRKEFQTVRRALATYLHKSLFLGAYFDGELIGFMKLTEVNSAGTITLIFSAKKHFDKRPNNALIAKAVEICVSAGWSHLIYGSFVYLDPDSTLTEFKRRNGFEAVLLPRYYIPLTLKGQVALKLGLEHELAKQIPLPVLHHFLRLRRFWYLRQSSS